MCDSVMKVEEGAKVVDKTGRNLHEIIGAVQHLNMMVGEMRRQHAN